MQAWYSKTKNPTGKRSLVFSSKESLQADDPLEISCGQCYGCRLEKSRQWATRCLHEASLYQNNCFITLTFSDEGLQQRETEYIQKNKTRKIPINVPSKESLHTMDFQLFMKRLRKKFGEKIRFFHCGEYGDEKGRPHYHACLFNFDFPDRELHSENHNGDNLYTSKTLSQLWPYGNNIIGDVTFQSAAYVARYIMKKINGSKKEKHYTRFTSDGEIITLKPEFTTMSRRPGIGKDWFTQYNADVYPHDYVIVNGKKCTPPKFYDNLLLVTQPFVYDEVKDNRVKDIDHNHHDLTPERLAVREKIQKLKMDQLLRKGIS